MFGLGIIAASALQIAIGRARRQVEVWDWRPRNSLLFTSEGVDISSAGTLSVYLRVHNCSPLDWDIDSGRLEHVRIGSTPVTCEVFMRRGAGGAVVPAYGSLPLLFVGGPVAIGAGEPGWVPVMLGENTRTTPLDEAPAGFVSVVSAHPDDFRATIPPLQTVATLSHYRENPKHWPGADAQ